MVLEINLGVILAPLAIELPEKSYQIRVHTNGSAELAIARHPQLPIEVDFPPQRVPVARRVHAPQGESRSFGGRDGRI
jgi:hypothetical protein